MKQIVNYLKLPLIGALIFLAMHIIYNIFVGNKINLYNALVFFSWAMFFFTPLHLANAYTINWADSKFNLTWNKPIKKVFIGFLVGTIVTLIIGAILIVLMYVIKGKSIDDLLVLPTSKGIIIELQRFVWISLLVSSIYYIISFINHYQDNKLKQQKDRVLRITTQHESLKSQIGPHFLFNSLNVLNGLISEDQYKAQEFVAELSTIYRYVLEQKNKNLVPLNDEINFGKTYMALVEKRYEDGLDFECNVDQNNNYKIVPLSLQILLENCIKHNQISSNNVLKVKVYINENKLIVINNLNLKKNLINTTKKGLNSITNLYKNISKQQIEIKKTQTHFMVKIPLLTQKIITMESQQNYTEQEYAQAKQKVEKMQGFYWNLATYLTINLFFTFLDLRDGSYNWAYWPLIGWGIGVFFHGIEVFGFFNTTDWKNKQIKKELEKRKAEREEFFTNK